MSVQTPVTPVTPESTPVVPPTLPASKAVTGYRRHTRLIVVGAIAIALVSSFVSGRVNGVASARERGGILCAVALDQADTNLTSISTGFAALSDGFNALRVGDESKMQQSALDMEDAKKTLDMESYHAAEGLCRDWAARPR